jgi:hypothetical protein
MIRFMKIIRLTKENNIKMIDAMVILIILIIIIKSYSYAMKRKESGPIRVFYYPTLARSGR